MLQLKFLLAYILIVFIGSRAVVALKRECSEFEWKCDSGQCIESDTQCDGTPNCDDGSDETVKHCIHMNCAKYAFRCSYGACIAGSSICNGVRDCVDNSDELQFLCEKDYDILEKILQGNCSDPIAMQCKSGECIEGEYRCDGVPNCSDGSDEILEICSHIFCPAYAFRCGYGACIPGHDKCDGKFDCLDGSDETAELCGYDRETNITMWKPTKHPSEGCFIPYDRKNLIVMSQDSSTANYKLGDHIATNTRVEFTCKPKWHLKGKKHNLCINNKWVTKVPTCFKYCSMNNLRSGVSTRVACSYKNTEVNCFKNHLRIGTHADISCAPGYILPKTLKKIHYRLTCDEHAEWDFPKFRCVPDCGHLQAQQNILISEMPWEVSIFRRQTMTQFGFTCGGAIISTKIIISASSCFSQSSYGFGNDPISYNVVEGHKRDNYTQGDITGVIIHNISEILMADYPADQSIALLVLVNYLKLSMNVQPICLPNSKINFASKMYDEVFFYGNQNEIMAKGSVLNNKNEASSRYFIDGIIVEKYQDGSAKLIRTDFFKKFIRRQVNRFVYIL